MASLSIGSSRGATSSVGTNSSSKATTSSSEDGENNGASSAAGSDGDSRGANHPEYKPGSGYYDTYDPTGEYIIEQALGRGGHGSVHLARHRTKNTLIALKITPNVKNTYVEVEAISKLRHPNVLKIFDCKRSPDRRRIYVYLELCRGGELFNKIVANPEGKLSRRESHRYCGQLLNALSYCHSRGIAHRDIKPENLLLGDDDTLKIADFGLAYLLGKHHEAQGWNMAQAKCGTALYAAPEIWKEKEYNPFSADIWSAGIVFFCCLCGYPPFKQASMTCSKYRRFIKGQYNWPKHVHDDDKELLMKILKPDPTKRYTSTQVLKHKLIYTALNSPSEYVTKQVTKDGLLRPTPLKETVETLKRRREEMSESDRRKKFEAEVEMYHFQQNNNQPKRQIGIRKHDGSLVPPGLNKTINTRDSVSTTSTDPFVPGDKKDGTNELAGRILRKVLGVSLGSGTLSKDIPKYSVSSRLKMINSLNSSNHGLYEGAFNAQWAVEELRKVNSDYQQYVKSKKQNDAIDPNETVLRRTYSLKIQNEKERNDTRDPPAVEQSGRMDNKPSSTSRSSSDGSDQQSCSSNTENGSAMPEVDELDKRPKRRKIL